MVDIDALFKQTKLNEEDEAKIKIKNHIYFEDVDDAARNVKIDGEAKKLLKKGMEMGQIYDDDESNHSDSTNADDAKEVEANKPRTKVPTKSAYTPFPENNTQTTRRPRWKFAAQIINTDKINAKGKKSGARIKAKRHGRMVDGNTLIEEAGSLRVATVEELESTSWKHVRNESEFMFQGVKDAWLKRELMGEVGGWGVQEEVNEVVDLGEEEGGEGEKEEGAESEEGGEGEGEEEEEGNTESDKEKE